MGRPPVEFTLEFLISAVSDITLSRYLAAAAITLVVYDWVLVFDDESKTIWKSQWTLPKSLYYFIRIVTLPFLFLAAYELSDLRGPLSQTFCEAWPSLVTVPMLVSIVASNWLFTLRLLALFKRHTYLVWFMRGFFFVTYAITLGMLVSSLHSYGKTVAYYLEIKACGALDAATTAPAMFYAPAAYEAFIFALTAYQAYKDASIFRGSSSSSFLVVLYRDGVICFLVMLAVRSWNIWIYLTQPITAFSVGINMMWALNTVLSTRVYLNLVWHAKEHEMSTSCEYIDGNRLDHVSASIRMRVPTTLVSFSSSMGTIPHDDDDRSSFHSISPSLKPSLKEPDIYPMQIFVSKQVISQ